MSNLNLNNIRGLSETEALNRLRIEGFNSLPTSQDRNVLKIALDIIKEPMMLLLIASGLVYLIFGNTMDALMLLGFVFVVLGITFYQERKTERTLSALRDLTSPRALVIREGKQKRIAGREVVRGDIIVLKEGDRVPADAVVISETNLVVDESILTGESVPVRKIAGEINIPLKPPGGDNLPFVYSGTLVVQGTGIGYVVATGIRSEIGKIGKTLKTLEPEETPIQKQTRRLVHDFLLLGVILSIAVVIVYGLSRKDWLHAFLAGITLAMAILPEEFLVVLTIFLALGAWRMSKYGILTRRIKAIQTLGSATVLCVDKTGTLTLNQMKVQRIFAAGCFYNIENKQNTYLPETFHELIEYAILASQKDPFDPMEKAIRSLGVYTLSNTEHFHDNWLHIREYPLSKDLMALSNVWQSPDKEDYLIAAKGAPEAIFDLCHLNCDEIDKLNQTINLMANDGLRVIGVARAKFHKTLPQSMVSDTKNELPDGQHDFKFEFLGLIGLKDPVRPNVSESVKECYHAKIRVIMITGDYPQTAQHIARQIGICAPDQVITGSELEQMTDSELRERIKTTNVFARILPEQKLRIVQALKENGEITVMTGDGVNDAIALKSAHIGIAMGGRGTDVAREASALVILDDDFSSIVKAIKMGRRILDNLKKAMSYILAVHVPIAGLSFLPVLFHWPLVLLPIHIAFLELIIDPVCSIVFEAEPGEEDIMNRPPVSIKEPLFSKKNILISFLQGFIAMLAVIGVYLYIYYQGHGDAEARALGFTTIVVTNLGLILANRSWTRPFWNKLFTTKNYALRWIFGITILSLGLTLYIPGLNKIFRFAPPSPLLLFASVIAAVVSILWFEVFKIIIGRKKIEGR
ncbi:MAG: cation-translocating P-type ATPase [candidate division WOR-3 bacterium]|nr:cation-translocating P-type ATPase [candidate division WOR-3 bacterium]